MNKEMADDIQEKTGGTPISRRGFLRVLSGAALALTASQAFPGRVANAGSNQSAVTENVPAKEGKDILQATTEVGSIYTKQLQVTDTGSERQTFFDNLKFPPDQKVDPMHFAVSFGITFNSNNFATGLDGLKSIDNIQAAARTVIAGNMDQVKTWQTQGYTVNGVVSIDGSTDGDEAAIILQAGKPNEQNPSQIDTIYQIASLVPQVGSVLMDVNDPNVPSVNVSYRAVKIDGAQADSLSKDSGLEFHDKDYVLMDLVPENGANWVVRVIMKDGSQRFLQIPQSEATPVPVPTPNNRDVVTPVPQPVQFEEAKTDLSLSADAPLVRPDSKIKYASHNLRTFTIDGKQSNVNYPPNIKVNMISSNLETGDSQIQIINLVSTYVGVMDKRVVSDACIETSDGKKQVCVPSLEVADLVGLINVGGKDFVFSFSVSNGVPYGSEQKSVSIDTLLGSLKRGDKLNVTFEVGTNSQQQFIDDILSTPGVDQRISTYKELFASISLLTDDKRKILEGLLQKNLPSNYDGSIIDLGNSLSVN